MAPRLRKKRQLSPLSDNSNDVFSRILHNCGLSEQAWRLKIFLAWEEAVGPSIAKRTAVQSWSRGVLVVKAASPTWQQELMYLRQTIIDKINAAMKKRTVTDLKVISGHLPRAKPKPVATKAPPSELDYAIAKDTSMPIADPDIRAAFERLMAKDRQFKHAPAQVPPPKR